MTLNSVTSGATSLVSAISFSCVIIKIECMLADVFRNMLPSHYLSRLLLRMRIHGIILLVGFAIPTLKDARCQRGADVEIDHDKINNWKEESTLFF